MPDTSLRALVAIAGAYAFHEYLIRRLLAGTPHWQGNVRQALLLFGLLLAATIAYCNLRLAAGYAVTTCIYVVFEVSGNRTKKELRLRRSLERFALKQLLIAIALYLTWRIALPLNVADWFSSAEGTLLTGDLQAWLGAHFIRLVLTVSAFLFMIDGGTQIVRGILNKFPALYEEAMASLLSADGSGRRGETENSGEWIGVMERIITLTFVLTDSYTAIAFAITAKSIARFKELENKSFAEYYLLGSISSLVVAVVVGIMIKGLLP